MIESGLRRPEAGAGEENKPQIYAEKRGSEKARCKSYFIEPHFDLTVFLIRVFLRKSAAKLLAVDRCPVVVRVAKARRR